MMGPEAYLRIRGAGRGIGGKGGWIGLESLTFSTPGGGPVSGKQTGRRIHDTVKVTRFIDSTTPLLCKGLCMPETDAVEFRYRGSVPGRDGKRPMLRCRVGKAVVVGRRTRSSPGGGKGKERGTEEIVLRCSDLKYCSD
jgi:hypothetical protein